MRKLKEQRLTPADKFVLDKVKGVKPDESSKNTNIAWHKDGEWLFSQDFKCGVLVVNYNCIWGVLKKEYGIQYSEIQQLIKNVMYKYTNNGQLRVI